MRLRGIALAATAVTLLGPTAPPAAADPFACTITGCASAAVTITALGCGAATAGYRACQYDCIWSASGTNLLPGDLDYQLYCESYGEAGGCIWVTPGGCRRESTTPRQARQVRCGSSVIVYADIYVEMFSGGLVTNADAYASTALVSPAC